MKWMIAALAMLAMASCQQQTASTPDTDQDEAAPEKVGRPEPMANEAANVTSRNDRTPLAEPKGAIDPKSVEAAGQVVQHYGALIEQKRWPEAERLWGNASQASQSTSDLKRFTKVHIEIGKPNKIEGAAGSIYVTMPLHFYGVDARKASFRIPAIVTLRRVNDVPGSTAEQRRWHIDRIIWVRMG
jgi:hypothetical protein